MTSNFFLIIQASFVQDALEELKEKFPQIASDYSLEVTKAGIEIKELPLLLGFELNHHLKIPTRILMRLASFKCRDFPKLYQKTLKLESLRYYLREDLPVIHVTSVKSRLNHSDKIRESMEKAITKIQIAFPPSPHPQGKKNSPDLYVRLQDDELQISVDTSGEALYKRGTKTFVSKAPLRENLAAALLSRLKKAIPQDEKLTELIDPMCGMGTFLFEASNYHKRVSSDSREFIYENFPILRKLPKGKKNLAEDKLRATDSIHYLGIEKDSKTFESLKGMNELQGNKLELLHQDYKDYKENKKESEAKTYRALISNPPYGKRIKIKGSPLAYYINLIESYKTLFSPHIMGIIIPGRPDDFLIRKIKVQANFCQLIPFQNGGLSCCFLIFS